MKKILVAVVVLFLLSVGLTQAALININTVFDNVANVIQQIPNAVTAQFRAASFMATSTTATSSFAGQVSIPKLNADVYVDGTIYPQTNAGIQSAINKVCGAGGGTVVLSPATYLITTQINLCSNMRLTGYGSSTILKPQTNLFALQVDAKSNVAITNLMIDGQNSTNTIDAAGIRIKNSSRVRVDQNIIINQSAFAVFVDSSGVSTSSSIWITNNTLEGEGTNDVIGGGPQNSTGAQVKDVYVTGNNVTQDCTVGTYCNAFDLVAMNNFIVQGNIFYGIVQPGMEQFPHANLNITGNNIFPAIGKTSTALYISTTDAATATSSRIILANNNIKDGTIEVFGTSTSLVQNVVVSGNSVITGSLQDGISFKYVNGASVTGNVIDGGESGIELATSSNFMIGGNSIANSNYGIKTDTKSTGITIGINRYTNILNQDVQSQPVVNLIRTSSSQTADFAIRDSLYDADGTAGKFYFSNFADRLGIYRGVQGSSGSERMRIDSSKVTFGDLAVQIRSLGVFDGIDVMRFNAAGNSFINNGFNLGLGTTTATERLHIAGGLRLTGNFMDSANATGTLGQLLQSTGTSTRWVSTSTLGFSSGGSGTVASGTAGQVAYYQTNGTSVVGTSTLFISTSSQVGVGITAPQATLDIASTTPTFRLTNTVNSSWAPGIVNGAIDFFSQDLSNIGQHTITSIQSINDIAGTPTSPSGALAFFTAINGTNTTEKMRLSSAGFLGLGTTTPDTMLSVVGTTTLATTSITSLSLGSLSGLLKATTGLVSVATAGTDYIANTIGDWTGTFDGLEGTAYLARANHTGTQLAATISDFVATVRTSISETITGLDYNNTTGVLSTTAGFNIPLTASTTNWNAFYDIPSTRITAGTNLSWSGNTLNAAGGGSNWTIVTGGLQTSTSTDFAQAAYFVASSTTGTSTFAGKVGIGTTTPDLFSVATSGGAIIVAQQNGRVGIGRQSAFTTGSLDVLGAMRAGCTLSGCNTLAYVIGDDASLSDINVANTFGIGNSSGAGSGGIRFGGGGAPTVTGTTAGFLGIGTTTPNTALSVVGTTTTSGLSIASLSGFLKATAGVVSTSLINLASDVSGLLGISNGGTGTSTAPTQDQILVGNGTNYDYRRITAGTNILLSTSTAGQIIISSATSTASVVAGRIYRNSNQAIPTGTGYADMSWSTVGYEQNGDFWTTGTSTTIPESGYYQIFAEATFDGAGLLAVATADMQIVLNNTTIIATDQVQIMINGKGVLQAFTQRQFNAGDTFKVQVRHTDAGSLNVIAQGDHSPDIVMTKLNGAKGDTGATGGISRSITNIAVNTTAGAVALTDYVYFVSGTTAVTLPTAIGNTNQYTIKRVGTNTVTINTTSAQTIDGSTTATLNFQYESLDLVSDGTNWNVI